MILALYGLALVALAVHAPAAIWEPGTRELLVVLGLLGAWRWCWELVHLSRALIYRRLRFPALRRAADRLAHAGRPSEVYLVITGVRGPAETTTRVLQSAVAETMLFGGPVTIVTAIDDAGDRRLIKQVFRHLEPPDEIRLVLTRRPGPGERHDLACALRAISRMIPAGDAAVVVTDGNTLLPARTLERALPFLKLLPEVDGIATDEGSLLADGRMMRAWHELGAARRHQLMSSLALSRRLTSTTGGLSIIRARTATDPDFIRMIEAEPPGHRGSARLRPFTGAHEVVRSSLLRAGQDMLYLPDVRVVAIREPRRRSFAGAGLAELLPRSGDAPGPNGQALALGPARVGWFLWCCLVDQEISRWARRIGPLAVLVLALANSWVFLWAYALWVGVTRLLQGLFLLAARPRIDGLWPLLIRVRGVHPALPRIWARCRPDRPRRPRHGTAPDASAGPAPTATRYPHDLALVVLIAALACLTGGPDLVAAGALRAGL